MWFLFLPIFLALPAGATIIKQGDVGGSMYVIQLGKAIVSVAQVIIAVVMTVVMVVPAARQPMIGMPLTHRIEATRKAKVLRRRIRS